MVFIKLLSVVMQFLHILISKRKKKTTSNEEKRNEYRDKIVRVILILIIQDLDKVYAIE